MLHELIGGICAKSTAHPITYIGWWRGGCFVLPFSHHLGATSGCPDDDTISGSSVGRSSWSGSSGRS